MTSRDCKVMAGSQVSKGSSPGKPNSKRHWNLKYKEVPTGRDDKGLPPEQHRALSMYAQLC